MAPAWGSRWLLRHCGSHARTVVQCAHSGWVGLGTRPLVRSQRTVRRYPDPPRPLLSPTLGSTGVGPRFHRFAPSSSRTASSRGTTSVSTHHGLRPLRSCPCSFFTKATEMDLLVSCMGSGQQLLHYASVITGYGLRTRSHRHRHRTTSTAYFTFALLGPLWVLARFGDVPSAWTLAGGTGFCTLAYSSLLCSTAAPHALLVGGRGGEAGVHAGPDDHDPLSQAGPGRPPPPRPQRAERHLRPLPPRDHGVAPAGIVERPRPDLPLQRDPLPPHPLTNPV